MPLQFFLAQARRQRLREQHRIWVQEELKHLEQEEEVVAGGRVKGLAAGGEVSRALEAPSHMSKHCAGGWDPAAVTADWATPSPVALTALQGIDEAILSAKRGERRSEWLVRI